MNVSLTPELEKFVAAKVESGRYTSASEVMREALRLLEEQETIRSAQLAAFNQEVANRLRELDEKRFTDPDEVRERLRSKSAERRKKTA